MPSVEADPTVQKRCRDGVQSLRRTADEKPMPIVVIAISLLLTALQAPVEIRGAVVDLSGAAVPDATVTLIVDGNEQVIALADDGTFAVSGRAGTLRVQAVGFEDLHVRLEDAAVPLRLVLQPASFADSIVVTADRGATRLPSGASATVLSSAELANAAGGALDDVLRQTPGFTLFRRSSSRTANPTTQGVTLRGVSGSGASRTIVLADGVPLNDPFGSWVYWNRVPLAAIDRVEVVRGGAGDLVRCRRAWRSHSAPYFLAEPPASACSARWRIPQHGTSVAVCRHDARRLDGHRVG